MDPVSASVPSSPVVADLERDGVRYAIDVERQRRDDATRGAWLVARDAASGRCLWTVEVFADPYEAACPIEMPPAEVSRMAFADEGRAIAIEDGVGRRFVVDLGLWTVTQSGGSSSTPPDPKPDNRPCLD